MDLCANEWKEIEKLGKKNKKLTKTLILRNDELLKARDALRWRKYPEEKPEEGQMFVALHAKKTCKNDIKGKFYWLPIPPMEEK